MDVVPNRVGETERRVISEVVARLPLLKVDGSLTETSGDTTMVTREMRSPSETGIRYARQRIWPRLTVSKACVRHCRVQ